MKYKLKEKEFVKCVERIPNESNIRMGELYKVKFFLHKDTHNYHKEIMWSDRFEYWFYIIGDNGKPWKQEPIYFDLNKKKIRKEKIINILKLKRK